MKKIYPLMALATTTFMLTACHKNPLKQHSESKGAEFLVAASEQAEKTLHLIIPPKDAGSLYRTCMEGEGEAKNIDCKALYKAMTQSVKKRDFKGIKVADLTDKEVYEGLKEELNSTLYHKRFLIID